MKYRQSTEGDRLPVIQLFTSVFSDSEGESEGKIIGRIAQDLFEKTAARDLYSFVADSDGLLVGSAFLSRLTLEQDLSAFLLAPVAVSSDQQGKGIGQALIRHALSVLREQGGKVAITYGDPAFYGKVGFQALSQDTIAAPYELSQPHGWLGQSLVGNALETLSGKCACVEAFRDPALW